MIVGIADTVPLFPKSSFGVVLQGYDLVVKAQEHRLAVFLGKHEVEGVETAP